MRIKKFSFEVEKPRHIHSLLFEKDLKFFLNRLKSLFQLRIVSYEIVKPKTNHSFGLKKKFYNLLTMPSSSKQDKVDSFDIDKPKTDRSWELFLNVNSTELAEFYKYFKKNLLDTSFDISNLFVVSENPFDFIWNIKESYSYLRREEYILLSDIYVPYIITQRTNIKEKFGVIADISIDGSVKKILNIFDDDKARLFHKTIENCINTNIPPYSTNIFFRFPINPDLTLEGKTKYTVENGKIKYSTFFRHSTFFKNLLM